MTEEPYINNLPFEIFEIILRKIKGSTLGRCRRVCKDWKELIDSSDYLWHDKCRKEFKNTSKIAKRKSGNQCTWYHIYRNLSLWSDLKEFDLELREFYKCLHRDNPPALEIDYGILPLKAEKATILYDTSTLENITISIPNRNCLKITNNDNVTVVQVKSGVYIQRTVDFPDFVTEGFFSANGFVLAENNIYIHCNKDVFSIDLTCQDLKPNFITTIQYDIKEIQYSEHVIYLFTDYGYIASLKLDMKGNNTLKYRPINCPVEWIKQIKHICAVDNKNFVCYSRNLIKIEVDQYKHLYLEFPPITALFFYVDIILFGSSDGKILLYRLSSQAPGYNNPTFETLARLPEGEVAVHLDVCERRVGPLIVAASISRMYVLEIPFFPHEQPITESSFSTDKLNMYKRMQRLKERILTSNNNNAE